MLNVEAIGLDKAIRTLVNIPKQVRFAEAVALTRTAKDVQKATIQKTDAAFRIRNNWLRAGGKFGIRIKPATVAVLESSVYVPPETWWMKQHETGGTRTGLDVPFLVKYPQRGKRRTTGPPIKVPRKGFKVPIYSTVPSGTRKQMQSTGPQGPQFRIGNMFFVRTGPEKHAIALAAVFKTAVRIKKDWGFIEVGMRESGATYQRHFDVEIAKAIASAF